MSDLISAPAQSGKRRNNYALLITLAGSCAFFPFPVSADDITSDGSPPVIMPSSQPTLVKIGVLAQRGGEKCRDEWNPTASYLNAKIPNCSFQIIPLSYDEIYPAVENKRIDFLFANPSYYIAVEMRFGGSRIATIKRRQPGAATTVFGGVVFCRADNPAIQSYNDLRGKSFMSVHENSLGAWHAVLRELKEKGINPDRFFSNLRFVEIQDSVVYDVLNGNVDAGAVRTGTLEQMAIERRIKLENFHIIPLSQDTLPPHNVLCSTRFYPEWPMAKLAHTSNELSEKVCAALLMMSANDSAAIAAGCAGWTVPLNYQPVHDCLKYLNAGPYKDYGKITVGKVIEQFRYWLLAIAILIIGLILFAIRIGWLVRKLKRAMHETSRLAAIITSLEDGVFSLSAEGIIQTWNNGAVRMFAVQPNEVIGTFLPNLLTPNQPSADFENFIERITKGERKYPCEIECLKKDGSLILVSLSLSPIRNSADQLVGFSAIARDVTAVKAVERKRNEAVKLAEESARLASIGVMAAGITHEINQPLNAIRLSAEGILLWNQRNPGVMPEFSLNLITEIAVGSRRISDIVEHMRSFWIQPVHKSLIEVEINRTLNAALELVTRQIKNHEITLNLHLCREPLIVFGDEVQMKQVFTNLIINAVHALDEVKKTEKRITISTYRNCDCVGFAVSDNGVGLQAIETDKLFDPFYSTHSRTNGMGLGLAIVKMFVTRFNGTITAGTNSEGGATFTVSFPVNQHDSEG